MLLVAGLALAQPLGPGPTPIGDMKVETDQVRLVSEELEITVKSADEIEVRATYQVHNPGDKAVFRFKVPVTRGDPGFSGASPSAASVRVLSDGRFVPCLVEAGEPLAVPMASKRGADGLDTWCTADLVVQPGLSQVRMSYEGLLVYEREPGPLVPLGADRRLMYALGPTTSWAGKAEVTVGVDLGPFAGRARVVSPSGTDQNGRFVSASLRKLREDAWLVIEIPYRSEDRQRAIAQVSAEKKGAPALRASEGDPAPLSDGDRATAWCAADAWLELEWAELPPDCGIGGMVIAGSVADEATYARSGAASAFTIAPCGSDEPGLDVAIPTSGTWETRGHAFRLEGLETRLAEREEGSPACVRVTLTPEQGRPGVCLSEFGLRPVCAEPP